LRDVHRFRGGRFGFDAEQVRDFSRGSNSADGIEARVFDDLPDLETERQVRSQEKGLRRLLSQPIAAAARQVEISI